MMSFMPFGKVSQHLLLGTLLIDSILHMQEPVLHLSLGVDSSKQSQRAPHLRADMRAQEAAQPTESQEAQREAPLDPDRNSGPTAAVGVEGEAAAATLAQQDNEATGAFPPFLRLPH